MDELSYYVEPPEQALNRFSRRVVVPLPA
jgi:hypothetical protein